MILPAAGYQKDAHDAAREKYDLGVTRQAHIWATGLGKTSGFAVHIPKVFPDLTDRYKDDGGLLFIVHRREILFQAYQKFKSAYPDRWIGIEMGEQHAVGDEDFIFVSVDSLGRLLSNRIFKYQHRKFGAILIDEGHHVTVGGTWDNILTYMGVGSDPATHLRMANGMKPLSLLLTATPNRHDGAPLSPFADEIVSEYNYLWGMENGYLCDIRAYHMLAKGQEGYNDLMMRAVERYGDGHQILTFCKNVASSEQLAASVNEAKILNAAHIDGTTDKDLRADAMKGFRDGKIDMLTNYGVFWEGTDVPGITMILDGAPTESRSIHVQKIGRGSRPHPSANVFALETKEERLKAIAESPKPHLTYIATFDPRVHGLTVYASLTGDDRKVATHGMLLSEVVDVITRLDEEMPEVPLTNTDTLSGIQTQLKEVNVWTRTVYNHKLAALSDMPWVMTGTDQNEAVNLWLPENPWVSGVRSEQPCFLRYTQTKGGFKKQLVSIGGWSETKGRPLRRAVKDLGVVQDLQKEVQAVEADLRIRGLYEVRGGNTPADPKDIRYLKNAGVPFEQPLTQATADLLKAHHRFLQSDKKR